MYNNISPSGVLFEVILSREYLHLGLEVAINEVRLRPTCISRAKTLGSEVAFTAFMRSDSKRGRGIGVGDEGVDKAVPPSGNHIYISTFHAARNINK